MENDSFRTLCWMGVLLFGSMLWFNLFLASAHDVIEMRKEAIKRGYAEWKVDENGGTTFTWK